MDKNICTAPGPSDAVSEAERILDDEERKLVEYRNNHCQGDDSAKKHAWVVANARLDEVLVIRRLLNEAAQRARK